ncbi:hypothetical protein C8Q73DRAFT_473956 [Cubamyces lactineus]|nr:hypothetical protein C8Q73DRAFT_473956 [Cubamyces lactineus]
MLIDADEERRIVELLGPEYLDVGLVATKVTGPPRHCPVCGKPTEFVDWVFTALSRGIHSPEFIVESLKLGNSPKKLGHDVYCSSCGHLTNFRDATGEEGGAPYLGLAPPYDRATRTFVKNIYQHDLTGQPAEHAQADETIPQEGLEDAEGWNRESGASSNRDSDRPIPLYWCAGLSWIEKREGSQDDAEPVGSVGEDNLHSADENAEPSLGGPGAWHYPWQRKRDAPIPTDPGWKTRWLLRHNDRIVASDSLHPPDAEPAPSSAQGWAPLAAWWEVKPEEGTPEPPTWFTYEWRVKRE